LNSKIATYAIKSFQCDDASKKTANARVLSDYDQLEIMFQKEYTRIYAVNGFKAKLIIIGTSRYIDFNFRQNKQFKKFRN